MNPTHLHTLLSIIDEGSFEDAAAALGISPSAVSQRIKSLEKFAGRVLLRRTSPVTATAAGEILVQSARKMALLEAETLAELKGRIAGIPLSVVVNADSLSTWFKPVLAEVARWENATLRLLIEDESHSLNLLRRGDVLGAVTREKNPVPGCESVALGTMRYVPVAHPRLAHRYTIQGELDWAAMPTLRFGPRDTLQIDDLKGRSRHRRISQIPSAEAFIEATRVGLGWSMLPIHEASPLLESGEIILLDEKVQAVPLFWQSWRLESTSLERLTQAVVGAAQTL
ncbi:LysR family transcriptional regulator ArgP [Corynebacterium sp. ES2794-CONJ1]|uniref:LysR family transcriptional regulator ArgP n=1 Tax=unclassified Corynebacterium TaxID=2624378 RepID=UPI002168D28C|nr:MULTISPECIES: LysR family transcriptional regulator ArgP [unclassified Corynebacterium]MCS4489785.1 LysR family transcriptional regulator ArgP [Corynebacterium sp. ES2775-CONJ]MCS4491851.1 LysR family transcriptional regulator ArgP [Corynebacterium sp. ES2715-CONJ3]MCU9519357.1 LysR family transcriptional regulator ArgP [Corynebacterium sp. ES2794-CONJ1]